MHSAATIKSAIWPSQAVLWKQEEEGVSRVCDDFKAIAACRWDPARVLLDPYAPLVKGRAKFSQRDDFERYQEKVRHRLVWWCLP